MGDGISFRHTTRKTRKPSWPVLPLDVYELISSKLTLSDILRWKSVSRSCCNAIKYIVEKSPSFTWLAEPPCLLLYPDQDLDRTIDVDDGIIYDEGFVFYNLNSGKFSKLKNTIPKELSHGVFLGLSQGWVLFLSKKLEFVLLNPMLCGAQLPLPPLCSFPDIQRITYDLDQPIIKWRKPAVTFTSLELFSASFQSKVVVCPRWSCSSRIRNKDIFGVIVMYYVLVNNQETTGPYNLAFCNTNADVKWTKLDKQGGYKDIVWHQNHLYALRNDWSSVTVWGFENSLVPIKMNDIQSDGEAMRNLDDQYVRVSAYMIKTPEDLLLVWRTWTSMFFAFKLDCSYGRRRWIEVESIGNYALVLDRRQSMLISAGHDASRWDKNSIFLVEQLQTTDSRSNDLVAFDLKRREKGLENGLPAVWKDDWPVVLG